MAQSLQQASLKAAAAAKGFDERGHLVLREGVNRQCPGCSCVAG